CYQLPALMRTDLTLVVAPLVSLMQDQVEALERVAPGRVALVNAQRDAAANRRAVEHAVAGHVRLLYVAPERFSSPGFLEPLRVATGFDRPNLSFAVVPCATKEAGQRGIAAVLAEPDALPAIVYAGTRNECDKLATRLGRELGVEVAAYHAGLPREARAEAQ